MHHSHMKHSEKSNYTPLIVVFGYITLLSFIVPLSQNMFSLKEWILMFMGFWFVIFSLFKMIDLKGFAQGYQTYDLIAKKFPLWGFAFPFIELGLGVIHIWHIFSSQITGAITLIIVIPALIGVAIKMIKKEAIECACLGTVLKVPLTNISLFENVLMIVLATVMIVFY
jgi:hypothetical protein